MEDRKERKMGRSEAKEWLKTLSTVVADIQADVSSLLPMIKDFRVSVFAQLSDDIKAGVQAERLLEKLK